MPRFRGCAIFRTRVIRQKVSLKIVVFNTETPCWRPSEGLQYGGRKPVETRNIWSLVCLSQKFILSAKLEYSRIGTSLNILVRKQGSRVGAVVRALASHQCVPGSIPGPGVICGLSLLLVLYSAPRGFSPGTPVFPSHQKPTLLNSNSIWKQWMKSHLVEMPLQNPIIIIIIIIKHKANRCFRTRNMLPRNSADVTHCEKTVFYFQNKAVYRAEDRPTDICLKMAFT